MSEWQDISTAPKDGAVVDLWVRFSGSEKYEGRMTNMFWTDGKWMCWGGELEPADIPTHWMPLPTPPIQ